MRALLLERIGVIGAMTESLRLGDIPVPRPKPGEVRLQVLACGVCHTELDKIESRTPQPKSPVVPGHEVVGRVVELGRGTAGFQIGSVSDRFTRPLGAPRKT